VPDGVHARSIHANRAIDLVDEPTDVSDVVDLTILEVAASVRRIPEMIGRAIVRAIRSRNDELLRIRDWMKTHHSILTRTIRSVSVKLDHERQLFSGGSPLRQSQQTKRPSPTNRRTGVVHRW